MGKFKDLTDMRFGRYLVIKQGSTHIDKSGRRRLKWICKCDCGSDLKEVFGDNLAQGYTQSCGCLHKERAAKAKTAHGDTETRLYGVWCAIKRRCNNQDVPEYKNYGGRGITMCADWSNSYESFKIWALENGYDENAPRGVCTIDRIDNNDGYYPENCRWVSQRVQMNNVRTNVIVEYKNEKHTVAEWARKYNIRYSKLSQRLKRYGFSTEQALTKK